MRRPAAEQWCAMKHASTRAVFEHWNVKRGARPAPGRSDIDPVAIAPALGDTFTLSTDFLDQLRFRLAGTRVCALFCREIKGEIFAELWGEKNRKAIEDVLAIVTGETTGIVTGLTGFADDGAIAELEMLLLPLARIGHARTSVIGVLAPAAAPLYWIGSKPVVDLELKTVRHLGAETTPPAAARFGSRVDGSPLQHGFTVYEGGLAETPTEQAG